MDETVKVLVGKEATDVILFTPEIKARLSLDETKGLSEGSSKGRIGGWAKASLATRVEWNRQDAYR